MLISEAWEAYHSDKTLIGYSKHTMKAYKIQADLLIRYFGDIPMQQITYESLKAYLMKDVERLKPASLGHRVRFLKSIFRWSVDEGHLSKNVASGLKEPKIGQRIPKALSEEEVETIREACVSPLEHAIVEFMYTTGCRIGEIIQIDQNQIKWADRSVIVHGKGSKDREVFFNARCEIWLKKYLNSRHDADPALFVTERAPHRISIHHMRTILKCIAKRAGMKKNIYPHTMRHSYAMNLLNNGAPMEAIQSLLGHSKMDTTRIYAELNGPMRRDLYKKYF